MKQFRIPIENLRSKSWDAFAAPGARVMDYVFTVCDQAAGEVCPIWPGHPVTAHWGLPDPAAAVGSPAEQMLAFRDAFRILEARIRYFLTFRFKDMMRAELEQGARDAGKIAPAPKAPAST